MIYSCFDQDRGLYRYFQDATSRPINADLPVPTFSGETKMGYAAIAAARPLPRGAKRVGEGWHARGIVVRCPGGDLSGLGALDEGMGRNIALALAIVGGVVIYQLVTRTA